MIYRFSDFQNQTFNYYSDSQSVCFKLGKILIHMRWKVRTLNNYLLPLIRKP